MIHPKYYKLFNQSMFIGDQTEKESSLRCELLHGFKGPNGNVVGDNVLSSPYTPYLARVFMTTEHEFLRSQVR